MRATLLLATALALGCSTNSDDADGSAGDAGRGGRDAARPGDDGSLDSDTAKTDGVAEGDAARSADGSSPAKIWRPKPGTSWAWQLDGTLDRSIDVTMYDIDLFDNSAATIAALKKAHRVVICYFSAGSYESWRPDAKSFPAAVLGKRMSGWNERWLDVRAKATRDVMVKRLALAASKGCDGVEPDNVDGFANDTGFSLTGADQRAYNKFLAAEAHKRSLSVGLKNDLGQIKQLVSSFDWALDEECYEYSECAQLTPFIQANKAVFHVEYTPVDRSKVCAVTRPLKLSTLFKHLSLDAWYQTCP